MQLRRIACAALSFFVMSAVALPSSAAEMTFQMVNDTDRQLSVKLFSRAESRQEWPSKTKAFALRPDEAVQEIKISCETGEQICWGAFMTTRTEKGEIVGPQGQRAHVRTSKFSAGVGDRGQRTCERCCHICADGAVTPLAKLSDPRAEAK